MQAFSAGGFHKAGEAYAAEKLMHLPRADDHVGKGKTFTRVQIEHDPVGTFGTIDPRTPWMNFQHAHLHQRYQTGGVREIEISTGFFEAGDGDFADLWRYA